MESHLDGFAVAAAIPERVGDLDRFNFDALLLRQPLLSQFFPFEPFLFFPCSVRKKRRVDVRIFDRLLARRVISNQPCVSSTPTFNGCVSILERELHFGLPLPRLDLIHRTAVSGRGDTADQRSRRLCGSLPLLLLQVILGSLEVAQRHQANSILLQAIIDALYHAGKAVTCVVFLSLA